MFLLQMQEQDLLQVITVGPGKTCGPTKSQEFLVDLLIIVHGSTRLLHVRNPELLIRDT